MTDEMRNYTKKLLSDIQFLEAVGKKTSKLNIKKKNTSLLLITCCMKHLTSYPKRVLTVSLCIPTIIIKWWMY